MPKINQEEYEVLKGLDDKWEWIARDDNCDASLFCFENRPYKNTKSGNWDPTVVLHYKYFGKHYSKFQFIQWEDEEPYNIAELIEEYESSQMTYFDRKLISEYECLTKESEETEVKNIEWLKEKVKGEYEYNRAKHNKEGFEGYAHREFVFKYVLGLLNQLDEPEVLSQEWISENVEYAYFDMLDGSGRLSSATAIIKPKKLQNLLVPKQEEVDRAYKDGYKKGKQHTFYKGYLEGLGDKGSEPETVADVVTTFWKSLERLKEVMSMEVEELE